MTVTEERPHMLAEEFERIAAAAEREGVRLEFIRGKLGVKAVPDGDHGEIVRWVSEHCIRQRPELWLYPACGLNVGGRRRGLRGRMVPSPRRGASRGRGSGLMPTRS